jgi:hypothetical protein
MHHLQNAHPNLKKTVHRRSPMPILTCIATVLVIVSIFYTMSTDVRPTQDHAQPMQSDHSGHIGSTCSCGLSRRALMTSMCPLLDAKNRALPLWQSALAAC